MARIQKDWVSTYLEHGIDYQNRRIFLMEELDSDSTRIVVQALKLFESKDDADTIEIFISTPGGGVYDMFGLYDAISNCPCEVRTIAIGKVMSAGPLLLTAGDVRLSYRNTWFMVHSFWWGGETNAPNHKNDVKHNDILMDRWSELMERGSRTPGKKWKRLAESKGIDYYFDAPDAVEMGLIERII
jgi:ATP-dependent Clp protease protease subunit